jgi:UDP-3-O-[3-hydroxymyristoyl] N-acetylglucosamine deacetylase/3-hydroxyacyl-[acyl-carrier-protein] dehydratase
MKQATIKKSIEIEGKGLHTGTHTILSLHPAAVNHGIKFRRTDIEEQPIIKADANSVVATQRCTVLGAKEVTISTVQHLLAALKGTGVSNVLIDIDGGEVPIMDGSALPFVEKILAAGVDVQEEEQKYFDVSEPMVWKHEASGAEYTILPAEKFEITTLIDFDSSVIGKQYASLDNLEDFATEIAPNRTFVFLHELSALADAGLVKGGELDNALVFVDSIPENVALHKKYGLK